MTHHSMADIYATYIYVPFKHAEKSSLEYCFHPWCPDRVVVGWAAGKSISETITCRKLILGSDIGWGL